MLTPRSYSVEEPNYSTTRLSRSPNHRPNVFNTS
jgi:hypothetical protein